MSKTVADIMVPAPIVVEVPGTRSDAINMMVRNKLTGLPVVRESDGQLMGIVSRRDIFRKFEEDQLSLIRRRRSPRSLPTPASRRQPGYSTREGSTGFPSSRTENWSESSHPPTS